VRRNFQLLKISQFLFLAVWFPVGSAGAACAPNSVGDRDSAFGDSSAMFVADTIS